MEKSNISNAGFYPAQYVPVGGVILAEGDILYNANRKTVKLRVRNTGEPCHPRWALTSISLK